MKSRRSRNPWPIAIVAYFVVFIGFIATFTVFACRQNIQLVQRDYYDGEVRYQQQLDRLNRAQSLGREIAITYDHTSQEISVKLPVAHANPLTSGQIRFYRPSDASLDRDCVLQLDARGVQRFQARDLRPGR